MSSLVHLEFFCSARDLAEDVISRCIELQKERIGVAPPFPVEPVLQSLAAGIQLDIDRYLTLERAFIPSRPSHEELCEIRQRLYRSVVVSAYERADRFGYKHGYELCL